MKNYIHEVPIDSRGFPEKPPCGTGWARVNAATLHDALAKVRLAVLLAFSEMPPAWYSEVYRLLRRLDPGGEPLNSYLLMSCARFLLRHG